MTPNRGEIWLVDFGEPIGREPAWQRPALVVSDDLLNQGPSGVVIVVPLTTRHRDIPSHIEIDADQSGLDDTSYARCEDVRSLSVNRLVTRVGHAPPEAIHDIERALRFLLGL